MTQDNGTVLAAQRAEEEILALSDKNIFSSSWALPLNAAPNAISLLGECMITASMNSAYLIDIKRAEIDNVPLPTCLLKCSNLGLEAFTTAQASMNKIGVKTLTVAGAKRTIDKIVSIIDSGDSSPKARLFLQQQLKDLKSAAELCRDESAIIQEQITIWAKYTDQIAEGTSLKHGSIAKDTAAAKGEETKKVEAYRKAEEAKKKAEESAVDALDLWKTHLMTKSKSDSDWDQNVATGVLLTSLNVGLGAGYLLSTIVGSMILETNVNEADILRKRQEKLHEEARERQQDIKHELQLLRDTKGTLNEFSAVAGRAVRDLQKVQKSIARILTFFAEVANNVEILVDQCHQNMVGELEGSLDDMSVPEYVRESIRDHAIALKASFLCVGSICSAYNDVSKQYILPGLDKIDQITLAAGSLSHDEAEAKSERLHREYTDPAIRGVSELLQNKETELQNRVRGLLVRGVTPKLLGNSAA